MDGLPHRSNASPVARMREGLTCKANWRAAMLVVAMLLAAPFCVTELRPEL